MSCHLLGSRLGTTVCSLGILAAACQWAASADLPHQTPTTPIELVLSPYIGNLRTVSLTAGPHTKPFLLDTGGGFTVLAPDLASALPCVPFGRVTGFRSSGERFDLPRCGPVSLTLGPLSIRVEATVLDLTALLSGAPPLGGLVSLQTLQNRSFTLDWARNRLIIETDSSLAQRVTSMQPISVRTSRQAGGAALDLFLEIEAAQGSVWLELDSGNSGPVLLSPHALIQLGLPESGPAVREVPLNVRGLGSISMQVAVKPMIYDGLLNAAFLDSVVLAVDLRSERAWAMRHR